MLILTIFDCLIQEHPGEGVYVSAVGSYVTKAVTVVELLKRKVQVGMFKKLNQHKKMLRNLVSGTGSPSNNHY